MANTNIHPIKPGNSIGATQDTFTLTLPVRQVRVRNTHATQNLSVRAYTSAASAAAAAALAAAGIAASAVTATSDNTIMIPGAAAGSPGFALAIFKSKKPLYVSLAVLGSGAATTFDVVGTDFTEGI